MNIQKFSDKGRTSREVNARIRAIPHFADIIINSKFNYTDENVRIGNQKAKKGVIEYDYKGQQLSKNIRDYFENYPDEYSSAYDLKVLELDEIEESSPGSVNSQNKTVLPLNPDELPSDISISDLIGLVNENAIGVTEEKYMNEYILKYKKRSGKNTRGNNSSNISLRDLTTSNNSLSQNNKSVNADYAQNSNNNTKNLAMHQGRQEMQILRNFQKLRGLRVKISTQCRCNCQFPIEHIGQIQFHGFDKRSC